MSYADKYLQKAKVNAKTSLITFPALTIGDCKVYSEISRLEEKLSYIETLSIQMADIAPAKVLKKLDDDKKVTEKKLRELIFKEGL